MTPKSFADDRAALQAYTIAHFCSAHQISRTHLYMLDKAGKGPRRMHLGRRVLISTEAAADWRRCMESAGGISANRCNR
jgi:hypothetical protein